MFGAQGQTKDSAVFQLSNLPPGNYGIAILDVSGAKTPYTLSFVLQQQGNDWKLGGFYAKPLQVAGHDGNWYVTRAREYKAKGQTHNAWLYFVEARELLAPVPFMSTMVTDKLYDESQGAKPSDVPSTDLIAGGKTFKVTNLFPLAVGNDLDLGSEVSVPRRIQHHANLSGQHDRDEGAGRKISRISRGLWRNRGAGCGTVWP